VSQLFLHRSHRPSDHSGHPHTTETSGRTYISPHCHASIPSGTGIRPKYVSERYSTTVLFGSLMGARKRLHKAPLTAICIRYDSRTARNLRQTQFQCIQLAEKLTTPTKMFPKLRAHLSKTSATWPRSGSQSFHHPIRYATCARMLPAI